MINIERLIYDKLSLQQGVNLPGLGSLRVEYRAAKFVGKSSVQAPYAQVVFSRRNAPRLDDIVDMMSSSSALTRQECERQYQHWLELELDSSVFEIGGVGTIKSDFFSPSPELEKMLNPFAGEIVGSKSGSKSASSSARRVSERPKASPPKSPQKSTPKSSPKPKKQRSANNKIFIWIAAGFVVIAAGVLAALMVDFEGIFAPKASAPRVAVAPVPVVAIDTLEVAAADTIVAAEPPRQRVVSSTEATTSAPYHVIAGMYSTEENADNFIASLIAQQPDSVYYEKIQRPSGRILVSIYSSQSKADATAASKLFELPSLWILGE